MVILFVLVEKVVVSILSGVCLPTSAMAEGLQSQMKLASATPKQFDMIDMD